MTPQSKAQESPAPAHSAVGRIVDGLAGIVSDVGRSAHAAYMGFFYGDSAIHQMHLVGRDGQNQEAHMNDLMIGVGGMLQAADQKLFGPEQMQGAEVQLHQMREQLLGKAQGQTQESSAQQAQSTQTPLEQMREQLTGKSQEQGHSLGRS